MERNQLAVNDGFLDQFPVFGRSGDYTLYEVPKAQGQPARRSGAAGHAARRRRGRAGDGRRARRAAGPARPAVVAPESSTEDPITDRWFWIGAFVVLVVAALIRLPELGINPFHHDEGVNGWFTTTLVRSGSYEYDPANYHGPTLYYFALLSEILFGLTNEAMRLVPVVFGLVTVGAVIGLRPVLGSIPVLVAGLLLALSPGAIYVSRYFIHEALLVAFTMTLVASALLYLRSRNPAWALGVGASAALIFATKETGVITIAVLAIAAVSVGST